MIVWRRKGSPSPSGVPRRRSGSGDPQRGTVSSHGPGGSRLSRLPPGKWNQARLLAGGGPQGGADQALDPVGERAVIGGCGGLRGRMERGGQMDGRRVARFGTHFSRSVLIGLPPWSGFPVKIRCKSTLALPFPASAWRLSAARSSGVMVCSSVRIRCDTFGDSIQHQYDACHIGCQAKSAGEPRGVGG